MIMNEPTFGDLMRSITVICAGEITDEAFRQWLCQSSWTYDNPRPYLEQLAERTTNPVIRMLAQRAMTCVRPRSDSATGDGLA